MLGCKWKKKGDHILKTRQVPKSPRVGDIGKFRRNQQSFNKTVFKRRKKLRWGKNHWGGEGLKNRSVETG